MQRRPQRGIGEAFVIAAVMRGRQIEHRQRAGAQRLDFGKRFLLGAVAQRPEEPTQIAPEFSTTGKKRGRKPAGHRFIGFGAGHAIGDNDEVHRAPSWHSGHLTAVHQYGSLRFRLN